MRKPIDLVTETIRGTKYAFRHTSDLPHKEQKHRYERRKIKEYLRMTDWMEEA